MCPDPDAQAHDRLTSPAGKFLTDVLREEDNLPAEQQHLFELIVERIGTIGAGLAQHSEQRTPAPDVIRKGLVELAAYATRLATVGTDEYAYPEA